MRHISGSDYPVWHPFTQMARFEMDPTLVIERGEGNQLISTDGRRYIDAVSSMWSIVHGHGHPALVEAIKKQADVLQHSTLLGISHTRADELASVLTEHVPSGLTRFFFNGDGSSAVEVALKMAIQYWANIGRPDKHRIIYLDHAYHGDTIGALSVGGIARFRDPYRSLLFDATRIPSPYAYRCVMCDSKCTMACVAPLENILASRRDEIAAVIVEPRVQAAGGIIVAQEGYLARLAQICTDHDVLLIADEIATGFGKTGRMFACDLEGVTPDLMAIGKGLTGGYLPMSATITTERVYAAFYEPSPGGNRTLYHGHTFAGNPICAAAAIANLQLFQDSPVLDQVKERANFLTALFNERFTSEELVGDIRQLGLMAGLELVRDRGSGTPFDPATGIGDQVARVARDHGVLLRPLGDVIVIMPPLSIEENELIQIVDAIDEGLDAVRDLA